MSGEITRCSWLFLMALTMAMGATRAAAQSAPASSAAGVKVLLDFEDPADLKLVLSDPETPLAHVISDEWASTGTHSLKITATKGAAEYGEIDLMGEALKGWEGYDYLLVDFYSTDDRLIILTPELQDQATKNYATRATYNLLPESMVPKLHKGRQTMMLDLRVARRNGKEGLGFNQLKSEDKIDLAKLTVAKFIVQLSGLKSEYVFFMDNVRLMKESAMETAFKVSLPQGTTAYQFGPGKTLAGFTAVSEKDAFSGDKAYGFDKASGVKGWSSDWPDPLSGRFIGPDYLAEGGIPPEADWQFKAKVPNGDYMVWLAGGYLPFPGRDVSLDVNSLNLIKESMSGAEFWSEKGLFRFIKTQYSEKPDALWLNYVGKMFPAFPAWVQVQDGAITIRGKNAFLSAVIILPLDTSIAAGAEQKEMFGKFVEQIRQERIRFFYKDLYLDRKDNEPCAATDPELALFSGRFVMPWSGFTAEQAKKITALAAPGEVMYLPAGLRPFKDLADVKLSVSDLKSDKGGVLSGKSAQVLLKGYLSDGSQIKPWGMLPVESVELEKDLTRGLYVQMKVPADAAGGLYKGTLTASSLSVKRELPIEVTVAPFKLSNDVPLSIGFFYGPPDTGQSAMFDKAPEAARDVMLKQQMELMVENGFTATGLENPKIVKVANGSMTLDFTLPDKVAKAARAAGMMANPKQRMMMCTLALGRAVGRALGGDAYKDNGNGDELRVSGFEPTFLDGFKQVVDWARKNNIPLAEWLVDEPRETPNPWNRNLEDTITYCKIAGKVDGAVRLITPMGDTGAGKDYTTMLDYMEIVDTHANVTSQKMMEKAMRDGPPELWIYNTGSDRYSNGFYIWRIGAGGKHEWHFNQALFTSATPKYLGRDVHNPFVLYEYTQYSYPASLSYPGGLLVGEGFITMHDGAMDYRYLHTLEQAIANAAKTGAKPERVEDAKAFLETLKKTITPIPTVGNLASEADLAALGGGIEEGLKMPMDQWRTMLAELIEQLQGAAK